MKQIVLGSQSAVKVRAVEHAIKRLGLNAELIAVKAASNVSEQPFEEETEQGAENRAAHAVMLQPGADYYLAIESGLFQRGDDWYDAAVVVLRDASGQYIVFQGEGVQFPTEAVEECRRRGGEWTVGKVLVEMGYVSQHDDPHRDLVGVSRADYIDEVVYQALSGLTNL